MRKEMKDLKLLDDREVASFIINGFITTSADEAPSVHQRIDAQLRLIAKHEAGLNNNILPRIPQLHKILRSSRVSGVLTSLLGPNYLIHPHRAIHRTTPVAERPPEFGAATDEHLMGKGSTATSMWHQDAQSPLARSRHHLPKYLIGFYYPHDVHAEMGPTRLLVASHLDKKPVLTREIYQPEFIKAGTFIVTHFDISHAGFPNFSDHDRYMIKFVFARADYPAEATWNHCDPHWRNPGDSGALGPAHRHIWDWMRGAADQRDPEAAISPSRREGDGEELGQANARLGDIYAPTQAEEIPALIQALGACAGQHKHLRLVENNKDDVRHYPIRWNERAVVMESDAYRLAAHGACAIQPLISLLQVDDPWVQINAAFALGEIGLASDGVIGGLNQLLQSPHQEVVRQALDALGSLASDLDEQSLAGIEAVVTLDRAEWRVPLVQRGWTAHDQVRMNAAALLLNAVTSGSRLPGLEGLLETVLQRGSGYAAAIAAEALVRLKTPTAVETALCYYADRCWDDTLLGAVKSF